MSHVPTPLLQSIAAGLLALSACNLTPSPPEITELRAWLSGAEIVPRVDSTASGTLVAGLNKHTNRLTWTLTYGGLTRPAVGAHFHGPASQGHIGRQLRSIGDDLTSPVSGSMSLTSSQMADLQAGQWYVSLQSEEHPEGEIRGQLTLRP